MNNLIMLTDKSSETRSISHDHYPRYDVPMFSKSFLQMEKLKMRQTNFKIG